MKHFGALFPLPSVQHASTPRLPLEGITPTGHGCPQVRPSRAEPTSEPPSWVPRPVLPRSVLEPGTKGQTHTAEAASQERPRRLWKFCSDPSPPRQLVPSAYRQSLVGGGSRPCPYLAGRPCSPTVSFWRIVSAGSARGHRLHFLSPPGQRREKRCGTRGLAVLSPGPGHRAREEAPYPTPPCSTPPCAAFTYVSSSKKRRSRAAPPSHTASRARPTAPPFPEVCTALPGTARAVPSGTE